MVQKNKVWVHQDKRPQSYVSFDSCIPRENGNITGICAISFNYIPITMMHLECIFVLWDRALENRCPRTHNVLWKTLRIRGKKIDMTALLLQKKPEVQNNSVMDFTSGYNRWWRHEISQVYCISQIAFPDIRINPVMVICEETIHYHFDK